MANYKWLKTNQTLIRLADFVCIPTNLDNKDYKAFLASGETPDPEDAAPTQDQKASMATDGIDKFMFEILFQQENRTRVLEGKAQITRVQFKAALTSLWKTLNP